MKVVQHKGFQSRKADSSDQINKYILITCVFQSEV